MVKINGYRTHIEEVEAAMASAPGVRSVAVRKEGTYARERLVCFIEGPRRDIHVADLRTHAERHLYGPTIPRRFYWVETVPRLPSGKIDRSAAASLTGELLLASAEPRTACSIVEAQILDVWREALGLNDIGVDDRYYDIGGDSLSLLDTVLEIEARLGIRIVDSGALSNPTVRSLAEILTNPIDIHAADCGPSIVKLARTVKLASAQDWSWGSQAHVRSSALGLPYALTYSQRVGLRRQDLGKSYFTYLRLQFTENIDHAALSAAVTELVRRHEMLRTTLDSASETQRPIDVMADLIIPIVGCYGVPPDQLNSMIGKMFNVPFDLSTWPLFRIGLFNTGEAVELVCQISHMIVDLFGVHTLTEDLIELYQSYLGGRAISAPTHALRNQEYVQELRNLQYSDDLMQRELTALRDYGRCIRDLRESARFHEVSEPGAASEAVLPFALRKAPETYRLLESYAAALGAWMRSPFIPIRVGTPARYYPKFKRNYLRLVTKGNDHIPLVLDLGDTNKSQSREVIRARLETIRTDAVNYDKLVCLWNSGQAKEPPGLFAFGPLGPFTSASSSDGRIRAVPRPLWGLSSFGSTMNADVKIGLFTFRGLDAERVHLHAKGVNRSAFRELCDLFTLRCQAAGLVDSP